MRDYGLRKEDWGNGSKGPLISVKKAGGSTKLWKVPRRGGRSSEASHIPSPGSQPPVFSKRVILEGAFPVNWLKREDQFACFAMA